MDYMRWLTVKETGVYSLVAVLGSISTYAFGVWTGILELFFIAIVLDWITGIAGSIIEGTGISSKRGYRGIIKKMMMILTVFFAHRVDLAFDLNWVMTGTIIFWLSNELTSIAENFSRCGVNFPTPLVRLLTILKNKEVINEIQSKNEQK